LAKEGTLPAVGKLRCLSCDKVRRTRRRRRRTRRGIVMEGGIGAAGDIPEVAKC